MSWQFFILANSLLVAISVLAVRAMAREKYAAGASQIISAAQSVCQYGFVLLLLPLLGPINFASLSGYWPWFLLGGVAFGLNHIFTYKLLSYLDAGLSSILNMLSIPFTLLLAALVLHEELSPVQAIGGFILLIAVIYGLLISRQVKHRASKNPWAWGLLFAVLGSLAYAIALVNEKHLLGEMNASTYIIFGWAGQVVASIALAANDFKHLKLLQRPRILYLTAASGISRSLSGVMFVKSQIKANNLAVVAVSSNFRLILVILLGAWWLRERDRLKQKLLAAGLSIIGLSIIFWK